MSLGDRNETVVFHTFAFPFPHASGIVLKPESLATLSIICIFLHSILTIVNLNFLTFNFFKGEYNLSVYIILFILQKIDENVALKGLKLDLPNLRSLNLFISCCR